MRLLRQLLPLSILVLVAACSTTLNEERGYAAQLRSLSDVEFCSAMAGPDASPASWRATREAEIDRRQISCAAVLAGAAAAQVIVPTPEPPGAQVRAKTTVNMRAGPGTRHAVLGTLQPGDAVTVLSVNGAWCECVSAGQVRFFVSCRYLSLPRGGFEAWAPAARIAGIWPSQPSSLTERGRGQSFSSAIVLSGELDTSDCGARDSGLTCLLRKMREVRASNEAMTFAGRLDALGSTGWAHEFKEFGQVDLVGTSYPFRANTNGALLMVNGQPDIIEAEAFELSTADKRLPEWRALIRRHPDAFLTVRPGFVRHERTRTGGQRFVFADVAATCRACEPLAIAEFAFDFASDGRLTGTRLLRLTPPD